MLNSDTDAQNENLYWVFFYLWKKVKQKLKKKRLSPASPLIWATSATQRRVNMSEVRFL